MPSLRQPVGPLPASIYWRRRLVVLVALAAVVALIAWLMTGQDGGGDGPSTKAAHPAPTGSPAQAITPGATPSGPARPGSVGGGGGSVSGGGGGEVSLGTGGTGGAPNPAPGTGGGSGTAGGGAASGGTTGGGAGGSSGGSSSGGSGGSSSGGGTGGGNGAPPVNTAEVMALPICTASQVTLELTSAQNAYQPKDKPRLVLTVHNSTGTNCRVDLGRTTSTLTLTASSGERVWSSGDCPPDRSGAWVQIPANNGLTETFTWDRSRSKPQCATPDQTPAPAGNYLVQADLSGLSGGPVSARSSIRLES